MAAKMSSGAGMGGMGGGGSIIKKSGDAREKRKLMEMSGDDRYKLLVAQKTMEVKSNLMQKKLDQMAAVTDSEGESKLNGKAKKAIEMMFKSGFKKEYAKTERKVRNAAKERAEKREKLLRGSNNPQAAAMKAMELKKQQDATQSFLKNMYSNHGISAPVIGLDDKKDGGGWW